MMRCRGSYHQQESIEKKRRSRANAVKPVRGFDFLQFRERVDTTDSSTGIVCSFCRSGSSEVGMVTCIHSRGHVVCRDCFKSLSSETVSVAGVDQYIGDGCPCARDVAECLLGSK